MTLLKEITLLSLSVLALAGCQADNTGSPDQTETEIEETTVVESTETSANSVETADEETDETSKEQGEKSSQSAEEGTSATSESDIDAVYEQIVALDPELSEDDMSHYSFMATEDEGYTQIELRQDNDSEGISNNVGIYRYYPDTEKLEKQDAVSGEFTELN